jgi:uncharacterized glyoxalase superfamily protein PhnB
LTAKNTTKKNGSAKTGAPMAPPWGEGTPPSVQPVLRVPDLEEAIEFYQSIGFEPVQTVPGPGHELAYAVLACGNCFVHLAPIEGSTPPTSPRRETQVSKGPRGLGVTLYCSVPNVDSVFNGCKTNGCTITAPPAEQVWGDRVFTCVDPFGYEWTFAQHLYNVTPQQMFSTTLSH